MYNKLFDAYDPDEHTKKGIVEPCAHRYVNDHIWDDSFVHLVCRDCGHQTKIPKVIKEG
jgi:hypothetical protein